MSRVKLGLFGSQGHQVCRESLEHTKVCLTSVGAISTENFPESISESGANFYDDWDSFISSGIDAISLCVMPLSLRYEYTIEALKRGIHVFSEKPCAMVPEEVAHIIDCAKENNVIFREMGGSAFSEPYNSVRNIISQGELGKIIQVHATKSYPWASWRPRDERYDGGLSRQVAIHAIRWIEHLSGDRITQLDILETQKGGKDDGPSVLASCMTGNTERGILFTVSCNYLNSPKSESWGNGFLRIYGDYGFVEIEEGVKSYRITTNDEPVVVVACEESCPTWFDLWIDQILGDDNFPNSLEDDLSPTISLLRANLHKKRIFTIS
jgi:predicted dehydrogenase